MKQTDMSDMVASIQVIFFQEQWLHLQATATLKVSSFTGLDIKTE